MIYKEFGNTGAKVSQLGFGAMRLPIRRDKDRRVTGLEESAAIVRHAIDKGVNYIDSALYYCDKESETAVGMAIKGVPRDQVYISTKIPVTNTCGECFRHKLELALRKLDTPYIDFLHMWDLRWWSYEERLIGGNGDSLKEMLKAKESGMAKHLSVSTHDPPDLAKKIIDLGYFDSVLLQYNLLDRKWEETLAYAKEKGLGTVVMGPVGGGRLGCPSDVLTSVAGASTTAELALRFVWSNPNVDVAISGMTSTQMVDENVATAENAKALSADEVARIDELVAHNRKLLDLPCTGCGYCKPCPQGVAISEIFEMVQWSEAFGLKQSARERYAQLGKGWQQKQKPASECAECGQCVEKCPQKIAIVEKLKEAHELLSG